MISLTDELCRCYIWLEPTVPNTLKKTKSTDAQKGLWHCPTTDRRLGVSRALDPCNWLSPMALFSATDWRLASRPTHGPHETIFLLVFLTMAERHNNTLFPITHKLELPSSIYLKINYNTLQLKNAFFWWGKLIMRGIHLSIASNAG